MTFGVESCITGIMWATCHTTINKACHYLTYMNRQMHLNYAR